MGRVSQRIINDVMAGDTAAAKDAAARIERDRNADIRAGRREAEQQAWNDFEARMLAERQLVDARREGDAYKKTAIDLMLDRKAMVNSIKMLAQKWGKPFDGEEFNAIADKELSRISEIEEDTKWATEKVAVRVEKIKRSGR